MKKLIIISLILFCFCLSGYSYFNDWHAANGGKISSVHYFAKTPRLYYFIYSFRPSPQYYPPVEIFFKVYSNFDNLIFTDHVSTYLNAGANWDCVVDPAFAINKVESELITYTEGDLAYVQISW